MEFRREVSTFGGGFRKKHGAEAGPWFLKSDPQITPYRWGVASKSAPSKNIRLARLKIPVSSKKNACHFDDKIIEIPWGLLKIPVSSKKSACHFDDKIIEIPWGLLIDRNLPQWNSEGRCRLLEEASEKKHGSEAPTTKVPLCRAIVFLKKTLDSLKMIRFT